MTSRVLAFISFCNLCLGCSRVKGGFAGSVSLSVSEVSLLLGYLKPGRPREGFTASRCIGKR